jgi:CRP-like cAMP-binding protein
MHTTASSPSATIHSNNLLLAALPADEYLKIAPLLESVLLRPKQILYEIEQPIDYAYFPERGLVSLLNSSEDGTTVEVAVIGQRGCLGVSLAFGLRTAMHSAVVEVPGSATRIRAENFLDRFERSPSFRKLILRYLYCRLFMISQWVLCNRIHHLQSRLARLLLIAHDQVGDAQFAITHDFIASLLGTARSEVARYACGFRLSGAIENKRSRIRILNRQKLEQCVCECYWRVTEAFNRTLGSIDSGRSGNRGTGRQI